MTVILGQSYVVLWSELWERERDFSAQETAHMLLSLPLVSCSYSFITLSLTGNRRVAEDPESGELRLQQSLLDHYSTRTTYLDLSLLQFATNFYIYNGEIKERSSPVIVRTFPQYSSNSHGDKYDLYCKYQLVKHKPWNGEMANAWGGGEGCSELWITEYHSFLQTTGARGRIPHFLQELQLAQQRWIKDVDEQQSEYQDEWMVLCQCNPRFRVHSEQDDQVDWEAAARDFPREMLRECPNWITSQRHLSEVQTPPGKDSFLQWTFLLSTQNRNMLMTSSKTTMFAFYQQEPQILCIWLFQEQLAQVNHTWSVPLRTYWKIPAY